MHQAGLEPASKASEACVLSIRLWVPAFDVKIVTNILQIYCVFVLSAILKKVYNSHNPYKIGTNSKLLALNVNEC